MSIFLRSGAGSRDWEIEVLGLLTSFDRLARGIVAMRGSF